MEAEIRAASFATEPHKARRTASPQPWKKADPLRVIAVTSGKGGVGKSNVVVNLGLALAHVGLNVLLIDADLGLGNLDILLGLTAQLTLQDALASQTQTLAEVIVDGPGGLKICGPPPGSPIWRYWMNFRSSFCSTKWTITPKLWMLCSSIPGPASS